MRSTSDEVVSSVEDLAGVVRCRIRLALCLEETRDFGAVTSAVEGVARRAVVNVGD